MRILAAGLIAFGVLLASARAQVDAPVDVRRQDVAEAVREGALVIRATTDEAEASALLEGFRQSYPGVSVSYAKLNSSKLYEEFLAEAGAGGGTADILWSSAMDLQVKLVNDGFAERYVSREAEGLPAWAVWRYEAYGVTAEPVAIAYNRSLLPDERVPRSHADLVRSLTQDPEAWHGKVATYDPERSGVGFLFLTQNLAVTPRTWDLVRALGQVGAKLYTTTTHMLDRVVAGEALLAFDVFGAYALERAKQDPRLGVVLPADYTLITSRIAFIPKAAQHKAAARLFLDYMLSWEGQARLAARSVTPARADARQPDDPVAAAPQPIVVGPELLTALDQIKRSRTLKQWRRVIEGR
ncbi:extracellular solute-binding protein family 1 [Methylobacterium sp. 4-46]|uniref:ABC transporter substrate-binding protein n=1 Tax=unclassified Methylobacterium TaxID=2615210 RepID=UPI000152D7DF|nr:MULTISPECIES: ABC transporter substrate-binding protein [Methylobacterium]ACA20412.1 extracellular solute-binding protein family 1 [Methylobacterium sp. 4-46]WFT79584.1 ABC transporter substrate-binding protein [Methylobacterium nodulans]